MATGTGLDAQIGFVEESTPGTAATVTLFHEFNSETITNAPTWLESGGLRAGGKYVARSSRVRQIRDNVSGSVEMEVATKGMSLLFKHCVASSTTAATTGTQAHAFGGTWAGKALTIQVGRPEPTSTYVVKPFTYAGCKVTGWEFSCATGEGAMLSMDFDGISAATGTALATASYVASSSNYVFSDVTTATLAGNSLFTGGLVITGISIKGEFPLATERQGLGFGKAKAEQLLIGTPKITATLEGEFDLSSFYDPFIAETAQAFVLTFTNGSSTLTFNMPATKVKTANPNVSGPGIVTNTLELEALDDESNAPITITVVN